MPCLAHYEAGRCGGGGSVPSMVHGRVMRTPHTAHAHAYWRTAGHHDALS